MDGGLVLIFWVAVGALLFIGAGWLVRRPGVDLRQRFVRLGVLRGRTKAEIIAHVGPPTAVSALPNGQTLLQWQAAGYHIALGFDQQDVCLGVTHEFAAR